MSFLIRVIFNNVTFNNVQKTPWTEIKLCPQCWGLWTGGRCGRCTYSLLSGLLLADRLKLSNERLERTYTNHTSYTSPCLKPSHLVRFQMSSLPSWSLWRKLGRLALRDSAGSATIWIKWAFNRPAACAPSKNIVSGPSVRGKLGPHIELHRFAGFAAHAN